MLLSIHPGAQPSQVSHVKHIAVKDSQGITRIVTTTTSGSATPPAAKKARIVEAETSLQPPPAEVVVPAGDNTVQCWRCLKWLESPVNMKHDCIAQLSDSGALYTCRYGGV